MRTFPTITFVIALAALLLAACGTKHEPAKPNPGVMRKIAEPKPAYRDGLFEMKLNIAKTTFQTGEPIDCSVSLTYIGRKESVTIWGPRHYIGFSLSDGYNIEMTGIATAELTPAVLRRGETQQFPFVKSGGYSPSDADAAFWQSFYAEKELILPAGTYVIEADCNFAFTQEVIDSRYDGAVYMTIIVE